MSSAAFDMIIAIDEAIGGVDYWVRTITDPESALTGDLVEFHLEARGCIEAPAQENVLAILRENLPTPNKLRLFFSEGCGDYCGRIYAIQQTEKIRAS